MQHLFQWCDDHMKQTQEDSRSKGLVGKFHDNLRMCEVTIPKEEFMRTYGRLRKEGKVEVTMAPDDMKQKGPCNYLAIFDHRIVVGYKKEREKVHRDRD